MIIWERKFGVIHDRRGLIENEVPILSAVPVGRLEQRRMCQEQHITAHEAFV